MAQQTHPTQPQQLNRANFSVLALAYFPDRSETLARRALNRWLEADGSLMTELTKVGFTSRQRTLTPKQVALITEVLGEP